MWRKILGLALLAFVAFALSGCAASYRAHGYRDGYPAPGYVHVRGRTVYVPANGRYYEHPRHHKHHNSRHNHDRDYDRR
jgi:hypothetical protein